MRPDIDEEIDLKDILAFNGRGNVQVVAEKNGGAQHSYTLLVDDKRVVDYTITPEPHQPGRIYWFYQEDIYIPTTLDQEFVDKNPRVVRRYLERVYGPHLHLTPGFAHKDVPVTIEPNPYHPDKKQVHIHQGIIITCSEGGDILERAEGTIPVPANS